MKRGEVVTVAAPDDYGKPHPAAPVQADPLPAGHSSVVIWQMTLGIAAAPDFRSPSNLPKKRLADALANHGG